MFLPKRFVYQRHQPGEGPRRPSTADLVNQLYEEVEAARPQPAESTGPMWKMLAYNPKENFPDDSDRKKLEHIDKDKPIDVANRKIIIKDLRKKIYEHFTQPLIELHRQNSSKVDAEALNAVSTYLENLPERMVDLAILANVTHRTLEENFEHLLMVQLDATALGSLLGELQRKGERFWVWATQRERDYRVGINPSLQKRIDSGHQLILPEEIPAILAEFATLRTTYFDKPLEEADEDHLNNNVGEMRKLVDELPLALIANAIVENYPIHDEPWDPNNTIEEPFDIEGHLGVKKRGIRRILPKEKAYELLYNGYITALQTAKNACFKSAERIKREQEDQKKRGEVLKEAKDWAIRQFRKH